MTDASLSQPPAEKPADAEPDLRAAAEAVFKNYNGRAFKEHFTHPLYALGVALGHFEKRGTNEHQ